MTTVAFACDRCRHKVQLAADASFEDRTCRKCGARYQRDFDALGGPSATPHVGLRSSRERLAFWIGAVVIVAIVVMALWIAQRRTSPEPVTSTVASSPTVAGTLPDMVVHDVRSPDAQRSVQAVIRQGRYYFLTDGQSSAGYEEIGIDPPVFSPDSKHLAYVIHRNNRLAVVLDGKESDSFLDISSANVFLHRGTTAYLGPKNPDPDAAKRCGLVFSPNSARLAYVAWIAENQMVVVVDGRAGPVFDDMSLMGTYFSPDSKHLAYVAKREGMWHVVLDNKPSKGYTQIGASGLEFSDDWKEVRFRAQERGSWRTLSWGR